MRAAPAGPRPSARRCAAGRVALLVLAIAASSPCRVAVAADSARPAERPTFRGLTLAAAVQILQDRGLPVVFSSGLVLDSMRVEAEPRGGSPRAILEDLLRPHGLRAEVGPRGRLVVVPARPATATLAGQVVQRGDGRPIAGVRVMVVGRGAEAVTGRDGGFSLAGLPAGPLTLEARQPGFAIERLEGLAATAGATTTVLLELDPVPLAADSIVVRSDSGDDLTKTARGILSLSREEAEAVPHLGSDMFRALDSLPGADVPEGSSRVGLRGGRDDQVLILLDGLELLAPYHLQEFDSALSIVAPSVLDRAELMTSGYPAEYGDRLGGVVDLTTATPNGRTFTLGLGLLYGEAGAAGLFDDGRGSWYGAGRSGTYRLALELDGRRANPRFWDLFAKVGHSPARGHSLRLESLVAEDEYGLGPESRDEDYDSRWLNRYAWLAHDGVLGPRLFVETLVSGGEVTRNRAGESSAGTDRFEVRDHRTLEIAGIKQRWQVEPIPDQVLVMGFEARRLRSSVEYANERLLTGPLAPLRDSPAVGTTAFRDRYDFDQRGAFATVRTTAFESLSGELGLRYDDDSLTRESHFSPRLNLAWSATPDSVVRLAWGWFHQSQRPNEVQVEDGEVSLAPAERSEHRVLGLEHRFAGGSALWMEAFERRLTRARPRWENLFDPLVVFPELGEDRVRIDPAGGTTEGVEVAWQSPRRGPVRWQAAYTFSSAHEDLDGMAVRQALDQPHALRAGVGLRIAGEWFADAVWHYHAGWPTTRVSGTAGTGEGAVVTPELGPLRGERLPAYHRLDLRLRRSWPLAGGRLSAYLDLQNVYDRENVRGFRDFDLGPDPAGGIAVRSRELTWGGLLPSFGVRWEM